MKQAEHMHNKTLHSKTIHNRTTYNKTTYDFNVISIFSCYINLFENVGK